MALKALVLWLAILGLAMGNGMLREGVLIPALGGALLSVCIFLVALAGAPWYGPLSSRQWLRVGALWLAPRGSWQRRGPRLRGVFRLGSPA